MLGVLSLGRQRSEFVLARSALRFIVEGFRNRPAIIDRYRDDLHIIISGKLKSKNTDYIETKTVLEGLGLLDVKRATSVILDALERYPGWISEQAATAARYLPNIDPKLATGIYKHFVQRGGFEGVNEAKRQISILAVSDAFRDVSWLLRWYLIDVVKTWCCAVVFLLTLFYCKYEPLIIAYAAGTVLSIVILTIWLVVWFPSKPPRLAYTVMLRIVLSLSLFGLLGRWVFRDTVPLPTMDIGAVVALGFLVAAIVPTLPNFWFEARRLFGILAKQLKLLISDFSPKHLKLLGQFIKEIIPGIALGAAAAAAPIGLYEINSRMDAGVVKRLGTGDNNRNCRSSSDLWSRQRVIPKLIWPYIADRRDIQKMVRNFRAERSEIAINIKSLRTGWGRQFRQAY